MESLLERFLRYVQVDTQSLEGAPSQPSTPGQLALARILEQELMALGFDKVRLSEQGYLMAEIPANTDKQIPTVGFIAHLDTSPDMSGRDVKPQVLPNFDGRDQVLHPDHIVLKVRDYPEIGKYLGQTIITSDGTTLLGADNKAGIAIIITAMDEMLKHPELKHGRIVMAFTPDEEIGKGADFFDVAGFGADFAYTVDGGPLGELEYETFNAAMANIEIRGINVHPGTAYRRMKNALLTAMTLNGMLPADERPENTCGYEGFYHLNKLEGTVEKARAVYIIRDHDRNRFEKMKAYLRRCVDFLNREHDGCIQLDITDQYYNMREKIEPVYYIVALAEQAMLDCGIQPVIKPVRGGTDGARLSFMGLPCPNIFTGGHNYHSHCEFISLESMQAAVQVITRITVLLESGLAAI